MAIHWTLDEAARRVLMRIDGGATGRQATDFICGEVRARPELVEWDWIQDVRAASGDADNTDLNRVAEAFAEATTATHTVFVSTDPALAQWTKVMDHVFNDRRHYVVDTPEAASRLLDRLRGR